MLSHTHSHTHVYTASEEDDTCFHRNRSEVTGSVGVCVCVFIKSSEWVSFDCTAMCTFAESQNELDRTPWSDGMFKVQQLSLSVQRAVRST